MFEADVTAHYISQQPTEGSRQYILFRRVLDTQQMDSCAKHRRSHDAGWREAMELIWERQWAQREQEVRSGYNEVRSRI